MTSIFMLQHLRSVGETIMGRSQGNMIWLLMMVGLTLRYDMIISGQRGGDYTEITQRLHRKKKD